MIQLKGITWDHSRGYSPLVACSQRYTELYPEVSIHWEKRSLQAFADYPIEELATRFDLLIIDHPWVGTAAATGTVLALDEWVSAAFLEQQAANSVGFSHPSYFYEGHQWALAIDAATPVASYRDDLMQHLNWEIPEDWNSLLDLASKGKLAVPGIPIDLLMSFYQFCLAAGETPFQQTHEVVSREKGIQALQTMKELWSRVNPVCFTANPIRIAEWMSSTDDFVYCPFAYGYSNYSRTGYAKHRLTYANMIAMEAGGPRLRSTLGGTGLAVSAGSAYAQQAVDFATWIMSASTQAGLYGENGGQPGHLQAWQSAHLNLITGQYFENTLHSLETAYVRPRYHGYLRFQDHAGTFIQDYLKGNSSELAILEKLNTCYKNSPYEVNNH